MRLIDADKLMEAIINAIDDTGCCDCADIIEAIRAAIAPVLELTIVDDGGKEEQANA